MRRLELRIKFWFGAPIFGRKFNAPQVLGPFELDSHLEEIANGLRPLRPRDPRAGALRLPEAHHFNGDPPIMRKVMLGRITAAVKIVDVSAGALFKGLAQQIDASDCDGNGLRNPLAAPPLDCNAG
jgi:hypothetical protein